MYAYQQHMIINIIFLCANDIIEYSDMMHIYLCRINPFPSFLICAHILSRLLIMTVAFKLTKNWGIAVCDGYFTWIHKNLYFRKTLEIGSQVTRLRK